jgi:hypothetical protein
MASHWYQDNRTTVEEHITANVHERLYALEEQSNENKAWKRLSILLISLVVLFSSVAIVLNTANLSRKTCKDSIILNVTQKGQNVECPYVDQSMEIIPSVGVKCSCNQGKP